MFTGIIKNITHVVKTEKVVDGIKVTFELPPDWPDLQEGESIATNGVCLTVANITDDAYDCFVMSETLQKSTFGLDIPAQMNVERALRVSDRIGGHIVQGHVDDLGEVTSIAKDDGWRVTISFNRKYAALIINKGSITINGVSLTVVEAKDTEFSVALIPYTLQHTTLGSLENGTKVNLEFDILGKYILRQKQVEK